METLTTIPEGQISVMGDIYMPDDSPSVRENNGFLHWLLLASDKTSFDRPCT